LIGRRGLLTGAWALAACSAPPAAASRFPKPLRGLYHPPGYPRLDWRHPATQFLADAWWLDGSALNVNAGVGGKPLSGFSLLGLPWRTQTGISFSPAITQAGSGCGFNGSSQYIWATLTAGIGPWKLSPTAATMLFVGQCNATSAAVQTFMSIENHATQSRTASFQLGAGTGTLAVDWQHSTSTVVSGNFSQSVTLKKPFAAALALNFATSTATAFGFGSKSSLSGSGAAGNQNDQVTFGTSAANGSVQSEYFNGVGIFGAGWNAVLPDSVIFSLLADPFQFLIFPDDDLSFRS
jgi:hypothetical protein